IFSQIPFTLRPFSELLPINFIHSVMFLTPASCVVRQVNHPIIQLINEDSGALKATIILLPEIIYSVPDLRIQADARGFPCQPGLPLPIGIEADCSITAFISKLCP